MIQVVIFRYCYKVYCDYWFGIYVGNVVCFDFGNGVRNFKIGSGVYVVNVV